jgi:hypothetical protein
MATPALTPEQEAQAQELVVLLQQAAADDLLRIARLLVSRPPSQLFGQTEFQIRDLVHHLGTQAYQTFLAQKKTATKALA